MTELPSTFDRFVRSGCVLWNPDKSITMWLEHNFVAVRDTLNNDPAKRVFEECVNCGEVRGRTTPAINWGKKVSDDRKRGC